LLWGLIAKVFQEAAVRHYRQNLKKISGAEIEATTGADTEKAGTAEPDAAQ